MSEPDFDLSERIIELRKNTESGMALVTAAIIDDWLQHLLLMAMRDDLSNTVATRILGNNGPLYDLSPKIDVAYAFGLIDEGALGALRTIKDIRNAFAHTRDVIHFDSEPIAKLCQKLPGWKKGTDNNELFDKVATACIKAIDKKTQQLLTASALKDETSPGK